MELAFLFWSLLSYTADAQRANSEFPYPKTSNVFARHQVLTQRLVRPAIPECRTVGVIKTRLQRHVSAVAVDRI